MSQHPELDNAVSNLKNEGVSDEKIRSDAQAAGWNAEQIESALMSSSVGQLNQANVGAYAPQKKSLSKAKIFIGVGVICVVIAGVFGAYAYIERLNLFKNAPYTEDDFVSGLLLAMGKIDSALYTSEISLYTEPRESDARSFEEDVPSYLAREEMFERDYERVQDVQEILRALHRVKGTFPADLEEIGLVSISDPYTNIPYRYQVIQEGLDFELTILFETDDAIEILKKYNVTSSTDQETENKNIVFTKGSNQFFFIRSKPPRTIFQQIDYAAQYLPPEIDVEGAFSLEVDLSETETEVSAWNANVRGEGDLGDLTYRVDIDARKIAADYFFRINNLPTLFFSSYLPPKGQWVRWNADDDNLGFIDMKSIEAEYGKNRESLARYIKIVAEAADEEGVVEFKEDPASETIDGRDLYRYSIGFRKESLAPFYERIVLKLKEDRELSEVLPFLDEEFLKYLKSDEFSEMFDYYDANTRFTVWIDKGGFPTIVEYSMRGVPSKDVPSMEGKQLKLVMRLLIDNINDDIDIEAPADAKTMDEIFEGFSNPYAEARMKSQIAASKAALHNLRAQAELVYYADEKNVGYGTKAFPRGECQQIPGTLFGDENVYQLISTASGGDMSRTVCVSTIMNGRVDMYAVSVAYPDDSGRHYCIDSTGNVRETREKLSSNVCI